MEGRTKEITTAVGIIVLLILAAIAGAVIVHNFRAYADTLNREEILNDSFFEESSESDGSDSSSMKSENTDQENKSDSSCESCGS